MRPAAEQRCAVVPAAYRYPMNILNTGGLAAEQAEARSGAVMLLRRPVV
jgi:hypothetical protein